MKEYRENRVKAGLGKHLSIDPCIVDEIKFLWSKGVNTRGCCCGHNLDYEPYVDVTEKDIEIMKMLGYKELKELTYKLNP